MENNEEKKAARPKPLVFIIMDGWGINQDYPGNAISQANTPVLDKLISEYPSMTLRASGESVGLPWGEPGNSEVGHLSLGLGRIMYQDLPRINKAISDNTFYHNETLLKAIDHAKKYGSKLHLLGLASNGCVHSSVDHLYALLILAREHKLKDVFIHCILDGRDTPRDSGLNFLRGIERSIVECGVGKIATISGRYYAMDRNSNWDRTQLAYNALVKGEGAKCDNAEATVRKSYDNKDFDEEFIPTVVVENSQPVTKIEKNDAVVFFNYRPDRARQITKAFVLPAFENFDRGKKIDNLFFACFSEYEKNLPCEVVFKPLEVKNTLGECLSGAGLRQLRISETEKYAHVTYFFNGGNEEKSELEDHTLVPSPAVSSYDQKPEMSSVELTRRITEAIDVDIYDFILINFPNTDMVGHTGNIDAAIKATEAVDKSVGEIIEKVLSFDGVAMITADHGNADVMFNMQTGQIDKEHSTNPVPFIMVGNEYAGRNFGWQNVVNSDLSLVQPQGILSDIAPTILKVLRIDKPENMTGVSLM
jgi:2,3-bisphosphoglycerate-independent phosphoglycerate mutase